jgi:hypothetical protein
MKNITGSLGYRPARFSQAFIPDFELNAATGALNPQVLQIKLIQHVWPATRTGAV